MDQYITGMIVGWVVLGVAAAIIATAKGRNFLGWFIIGVLLGLIGFIIAIAMPRTIESEALRTTQIEQTRGLFSGAWAATHEVPAGGMRAFGRPDPSGISIIVPGRTKLHLDRTLGDWAGVTDANGVSGWVNGQLLVPLNSPPTTRCPFCAELIQPQAIVCRWCGRDLPARGAASGTAPAPEGARWEPTHQVQAGGLSLRASPDLTAKLVGRVEAGTRLRVEEARGDFVVVTTHDGSSGWVNRHSLEPLAGETATPANSEAVSPVFAPCPTCGKSIHREVPRCPYCGRDLVSPAPIPPQTPKP